jgi:hypothetical protein
LVLARPVVPDRSRKRNQIITEGTIVKTRIVIQRDFGQFIVASTDGDPYDLTMTLVPTTPRNSVAKSALKTH